MTTIVGVQGDGFAVLGYDSLVTDDDRRYILPKSMPKVIKRDRSLFGVAGDLRALNLVSTGYLPIPSRSLGGRKLDNWVGRTFIPALRFLFDRSGYEKDGQHGSTLLIALNCVIFEIGTNYEYLRDDRGIYAIGSGGNTAMGSLAGSSPDIRKDISVARAAAKLAVEVSTKFDMGSGLPAHVRSVQVDTS